MSDDNTQVLIFHPPFQDPSDLELEYHSEIVYVTPNAYQEKELLYSAADSLIGLNAFSEYAQGVPSLFLVVTLDRGLQVTGVREATAKEISAAGSGKNPFPPAEIPWTSVYVSRGLPDGIYIYKEATIRTESGMVYWDSRYPVMESEVRAFALGVEAANPNAPAMQYSASASDESND